MRRITHAAWLVFILTASLPSCYGVTRLGTGGLTYKAAMKCAPAGRCTRCAPDRTLCHTDGSIPCCSGDFCVKLDHPVYSRARWGTYGECIPTGDPSTHDDYYIIEKPPPGDSVEQISEADIKDPVCPNSRSDSCPAGHFVERCNETAYKCTPCRGWTFQPHENRVGDTCWLMRVCEPHLNLKYVSGGSRSNTKDAKCECIPGYHSTTEEYRYCTKNDECEKGFVPVKFGGGCEGCLDKGMYSDTVGSNKRCKPLTNCYKQQRCIISQSDGTKDRVCGPPVEDVSTCEEYESTGLSAADLTKS